jgi:hypothetical protein
MGGSFFSLLADGNDVDEGSPPLSCGARLSGSSPTPLSFQDALKTTLSPSSTPRSPLADIYEISIGEDAGNDEDELAVILASCSYSGITSADPTELKADESKAESGASPRRTTTEAIEESKMAEEDSNMVEESGPSLNSYPFDSSKAIEESKTAEEDSNMVEESRPSLNSYPFDPAKEDNQGADTSSFLCDICGENINDVRFKCSSGCVDFDLCATCHKSKRTTTSHVKSHECIELPISKGLVLGQPLRFKNDWQPEDSAKVIEYIGLYGWDWQQISHSMGCANAKACYEEFVLGGNWRCEKDEKTGRLLDTGRPNNWDCAGKNNGRGFLEDRPGEYLRQFRSNYLFPIQKDHLKQMLKVCA